MKKPKVSFAKLLMHLILITISLTYILPMIMMISISLSSESSIKEFGYTLLPKVFSTEAYKQVFGNPYQILNSYRVTILFAVIQTVLAIFIQSLMAYPLSRPNFKFKKFMIIYIFITMLFSGGLVPSYILNTQYLKLGNTFWIYIFPTLMSAWNVILFKTYFQGLPEGLVESAKLDGASELRVYFMIILPLSTPVIATLGFINLLGQWNSWYTSMLYIRDSKLYSLQYLIQKILNEADYIKSVRGTASGSMLSAADMPSESMKYAMAVLAAGPMMLIFPFFQKYFAKGLVVGSIKG